MVALMPLEATPTATANAEPVIATAPTTVLALTPIWPVRGLKDELQGALCRTDNCVGISYPPFVTAAGVRMLADRLSGATDIGAGLDTETVVFGYSHGATVAARWIQKYADDPEAPSPDALSFVLMGNPHRAHGHSLPPIPQTRYQVIDIVRQYDPVGDYPDRFNVLAMLNVGSSVVSPIHLDYKDVDIDDPDNIVWTEDNVTYVFVPTQNLPLLAPLRLIGLGWLADLLNEPLKEIIEQAYDRPYLDTTDDTTDETTQDTTQDTTQPPTTPAEPSAVTLGEGSGTTTARLLAETQISELEADAVGAIAAETDVAATEPREQSTASTGDRAEELPATAENPPSSGTTEKESTQSADVLEEPAEATGLVDDSGAAPDQERSSADASDDGATNDSVSGDTDGDDA